MFSELPVSFQQFCPTHWKASDLKPQVRNHFEMCERGILNLFFWENRGNFLILNPHIKTYLLREEMFVFYIQEKTLEYVVLMNLNIGE